jgi:hypothetical protein
MGQNKYKVEEILEFSEHILILKHRISEILTYYLQLLHIYKYVDYTNCVYVSS